MKTILCLDLGIPVFFILIISGSTKVCSPPNSPAEGGYRPRRSEFLPGDNITYYCKGDYKILGHEHLTCGLDGDWSQPSPFCDLKANLRYPFLWLEDGERLSGLIVLDNDVNTCFTLKHGITLELNLDKAMVYGVELYIEKGGIDVEAYTAGSKTPLYARPRKNQWYSWKLSKGVLTDTVSFEDESHGDINNTICEISILVNAVGCTGSPNRKIPHGYFEMSRKKATLICENGYKSDKHELVCEENEWKGDGLQCNEILCRHQLDFNVSLGSYWTFPDSVTKLSPGTTRQLKCSPGYHKTGDPDVIICKKDGTWSKTTATCVEEEKFKDLIVDKKEENLKGLSVASI